jgi:hypothetical protein
MVILVPQQASKAVGGSKTQALLHTTVLSVAQFTTGGVVSTTVTVWVQVWAAPEQSTICQTCWLIWKHTLVLVVVVLRTVRL